MEDTPFHFHHPPRRPALFASSRSRGSGLRPNYRMPVTRMLAKGYRGRAGVSVPGFGDKAERGGLLRGSSEDDWAIERASAGDQGD